METSRGLLGLCVLLVVLTACGGGGGGGSGGGGGGDPQPTLRVTMTNSSVSWNYFQGVSPTSQALSATVTGDYSGTLYVAALVENNGTINAINPTIPILISSTQATATVTPASGLAAGTYTGRIVFLVCSDAACNNRIGGTPLYANFTVLVKTHVQATPTSIDVTAFSGTPTTVNVMVEPGTGEVDFTVGTLPNFVQLLSKTNSSVQLRLLSLPVGTYSGNIQLTGSQGSRAQLPVSYAVAQPTGGQHGLSVAPAGLTFTALETTTAATQDLTVTQPSWNPGVTPTITYDANQPTGWLSIASSSSGYTVTATAANLSAASYSATIRISSNPLPSGIADPTGNNEKIIPVAFTVGAGLVTPADVIVTPTADTSLSDLTGTVPINVADGVGTVTWNARTNTPLLTVSPSGVSGSSLSYSINPLYLSQVFNGTEYAVQVFLTAPGSVISPRSFFVRITPRLARVTGVGAPVQIAGQPALITVTGSGFNGIANPTARFSVSGATVTGSNRISDTRLMLNLTPLSVGTHSINVSNALNFSGPNVFFDAVTPPIFSYGTVNTGYTATALVPDDKRGVVYAVDEWSRKLVRFSHGAAGWTSTTAPVNNVTNVGVLPGGALIITTMYTSPTTPSSIRILNGDSLAEMSSHDVPGLPIPYASDSGIPISPDGRAWLELQPPSCGDTALRYYRVETGLVEKANFFTGLSGVCGEFTGRLMFSASRNGDRFLLGNSNSYGPTHPSQQPMVFVDTSNDTFVATNSGATGIFNWNVSASTSNDSTRTLINMESLVDGSGDIIGRVQIANYGTVSTPTIKQAAVLSPEGHRAYVFTGPVEGASPMPRIYVVDTSTPIGSGSLPIFGYFEPPECPNCVYSNGTDLGPPMAISQDGNTLFILGINKFMAVPIPSTLTPLSMSNTTGTSGDNAIATKAWPISIGSQIQ